MYISPELKLLSKTATQGKWLVETTENNAFIVGQSTNPYIPSSDVICTPAYSDRTHTDDAANMHLIAAAVNFIRFQISEQETPVDRSQSDPDSSRLANWIEQSRTSETTHPQTVGLNPEDWDHIVWALHQCKSPP